MRTKCILIAAVAMLASSSAQAADVTIKLNDQEQNALLQLLDLAAKQGGVRAAGAVSFFVNKLQKPDAPTTAAPEVKPEPKAPEKK